MKRIMNACCAWYIAFIAPQLGARQASTTKIVTAKQVNGTWKGDQGTIKVWALGKQRLRVELGLMYSYQSQMGPMANTGEGGGIAFIEGDTAVLKPDDAGEDCKIVLHFADGLLVVTESGDCGFGFNVTATGTYKKVSSVKPSFGN